jgi:hypothetical protein
MTKRPSRERNSADSEGKSHVIHETPVNPHLAWRFGDIPLQPKPQVGSVDDPLEREADRAAARVMHGAGEPLAGRWMAIEAAQSPGGSPGGAQDGGKPLPDEVRRFMEPRFGFDFSQVRVHTDLKAKRIARSLNAQAFTHEQHIYYGTGSSPGTNALTAHELMHVVQQAGGGPPVDGVGERAARAPSIQRILEVRPPGRGEASAFDRREELIDRLNAQSTALHYRLDGREIRYDVIDATALTNFDHQMQAFIDRAELVPMRLTTGANLVMGAAGTFTTLLGDSFREGYVDLDDLMADDDFSFRSDMVHFLTERFSARDYARRIGTNFTAAEFNRGHQLGKEAEAALLQELFNDPSIQFNYEESLAGGSWLNNFRSHDHGYQVFQVVRRSGRAIAGGEMFVRTRDGRRVTMEDFRATRAAGGGGGG